MTAANITKKGTPTPIPIFAPVERPRWESFVVSEAVGLKARELRVLLLLSMVIVGGSVNDGEEDIDFALAAAADKMGTSESCHQISIPSLCTVLVKSPVKTVVDPRT